MSRFGFEASGSRKQTKIGAPELAEIERPERVTNRDTVELTPTQLTAFVSLRQCGRYLRLVVHHHEHARTGAYGGGHAPRPSNNMDSAMAAAGHQVEARVATELRLNAPCAQFINPHNPRDGVLWTQFLTLLTKIEPPRPEAPTPSPVVGCWAAEVCLAGPPAPDSLVNVRGRADFVLLLWRGGRPVLRIVECKASLEPQTKHLAQVVLYRMLLLHALATDRAAGSAPGWVRIGGHEWRVPEQPGAAAGPEVEVECVLHIGTSSSVVAAEPVPQADVDSLTRQLAGMLRPGGRVERALDPRTPFHEVPYELDTHCRLCSHAPECWADSAAAGALQLSGCSASQAQRLARDAGLRDIEDLAGLATPRAGKPQRPAGSREGSGTNGGGSDGLSVNPGRWREVAVRSGIDPLELQRLALTARVRAQRRLGPGFFSPEEQRQQQTQRQAPGFALLPGAPSSCLPPHEANGSGSLLRVFLSVAVDQALQRVVGLAAHVADPWVPGPSTGPPSQADQRGWDVVELLGSVALDDRDGSTVRESDRQLDEKEARLLADFSARLCEAVGSCVELGDTGARQPPLHFYVQSRQELRALLQRCSALDPLVPRPGASPVVQATRAAAVDESSGGGGLAWLPHLLGLRADTRHSKKKGHDGEQDMVSVMEDELRRYVTVWQGAGLQASTAVDWAGDGTFNWRVAKVRAAAARDTPPGDGGGGGGGGGETVDLRAVFAAAGAYLDCLEGFDPRRHHCLAGDTGARGLLVPRQQRPPEGPGDLGDLGALGAVCCGDRKAAGADGLGVQLPTGTVERLPVSVDARRAQVQVQVRPESAATPIPPSIFRALWRETQLPGVAVAPQPQAEKAVPSSEPAQQQQQQPHAAAQVAACYLSTLLRTQAHAVRWLEERLVRLPRGSSAAIHKVPLLLPLGRQLLSFRLQPAALAGRFRHPRQGAHVPLASEVAGAAFDAALVNRRAEIRQFWQDLGRRPPAERARGERGGTLLLDSVRVDRLVARGRVDGLVVRGRVALPEGCTTWDELREATGLKEGDTMLMTVVEKDPRVCQDAEQVAQRYALCQLKPCMGSPLGQELWVECHKDFMHRGDPDELFLVGAPADMSPTKLLQDRGADASNHQSGSGERGNTVVLDAAPNISAWVTSSVLECLSTYGTDSAYLATRLRLRAEPPAPVRHGGRGQQPDPTGASLAGGEQVAENDPEPRTPPARVKAAAAGDSDVAGTPDGTPGDVLAAQDLFSPASVPATPAALSPPAHRSRPGASESHGGCTQAVSSSSSNGPSFQGLRPGTSTGGGLSPSAGPSPGPNTRYDSGSGSSSASSGLVSRPLPRSIYPITAPGSSTSGGDARARNNTSTPSSAPTRTNGANVRPTSSAYASTGAAPAPSALNPDQSAAVRAFLSHPDRGSRVLLQGPPGTGKTETVARAVLAWLEERMRTGGPMGPPELGGVVLLSGPTHTAIDTLMERVARRLREGAVAGGVRDRVKLVRLTGRDPLNKGLETLDVQKSVPTGRSWKASTWVVVGGTLRHLVKAAGDLRIRVAAAAAAEHASSAGRALMDSSGLGAFASALVVDEASMVFAPQLLALGSLLVTRGSLLVAGDHRQLSTIVQHAFEEDLRPTFVRHRPYVSAYDYMRLLAAAEEQERLARGRAAGPAAAGDEPPPIAICALTYTHRLPAVITRLIGPLYRRDGIELLGRPALAVGHTTQTATTGARCMSPTCSSTTLTSSGTAPTAAAAAAVSVTSFGTHGSGARAAGMPGPVTHVRPVRPGAMPSASTPSAFGAAAAWTVALSTSAAAPASPAPMRPNAASAASRDGAGEEESGVWRRLWAGSEGLFLVVHNEEGSARSNALEVEVVRRILEARAGGGRGGGAAAGREEKEEGGSVAIITPHRAQRRALKTLVEGRGWGGSCRVETVERLQGGEADTIIFSATVSDDAALSRSADFYSSLSRANVAFSRTRRRLIVVASRTFLDHVPPSYTHYDGLMLWRRLRSMLCDRPDCYLHEAFLEVESTEEMDAEGSSSSSSSVGPPVQPQRQASSAREDGRWGRQVADARGGVSGNKEEEQEPRERQQRGGGSVTYRCDVFGTAE